LVDVTLHKMKRYPEVGGGRSARKGWNLFTWRQQSWSVQAPWSWRLHDHTQDTPQSVVLLWMHDQPSAETSTW
jgi:hypothetical protein